MAQPTDETLQAGESLKLASASDIREGAVIRIWHDYYQKWIPGWWCEVLKVDGERVYLRDLRSGEEADRHLGDTIGIAYLHPRPDSLRSLGTTEQNEADARLAALRTEYERLDFTESSISDMSDVLRTELHWMDEHDRDFNYMREEFGIHEIAITRVGEELDRRGGMELMRQVCASLGNPRSLDMKWSGIGDWRG